ncbi:MAG: hypothetical protein K1Y36_02400 [Blastocatellia bacterium]|nr:hypothetical protein [Blastocatellia bacterium]
MMGYSLLPFVAALLLFFSSWFNLPQPEVEHVRIKPAKVLDVPFRFDPNDYGMVERHPRSRTTVLDAGGFPADTPAHIVFSLEDKRPLPGFDSGPRYYFPAYSFIAFIPLTDLTAPDFATTYPTTYGSAQQMRKLLARKSFPFDRQQLTYELPFNNAGKSFISKARYVDFKDVEGVFYLTQYSQEMYLNPLNNEELTYCFQGLTKDGAYYVAARFAVTHPLLPQGIDSTSDIGRIDDELTYLKEGAKTLELFAEDSFTPSLGKLREIIASLDQEEIYKVVGEK